MIQGVLQGSVLRPFLLNIYLNYLFFLLNDIDILNFGNDTTTYLCDVNLKSVPEKLEENSVTLLPVTLLKKDIMKLIVELH